MSVMSCFMTIQLWDTIRSMQDSIFTKIINGEIPGEIVYQDETVVAILTIEPLSPGHCLVIPREQIDHLWDVDDPLYRHLYDVVKIMAKRLKSVYFYPRIGSVVEGYGVPHAHIHVMGLERGFEPTMVEHAQNKIILTPDQMAIEAQKLRDAA